MEHGDTLVVPAGTEIADRVRLARMAAGIEREDLARAVGISLRTYERIETGAREARRGELIAIAQVTGQDVSFFGTSTNGGPTTLPDPLPAVKADAA